MTKRIHTALLAEFSEMMGLQLGLSFPKERWLDLLKGVHAASREFGFDDPEACIRWLMSTPLKKHQVETLASQFTVGETYFFREPKVFEALEKQILPGIVQARRDGDRRIRFWSAGCCTGEEAYSLAILISRMISDIRNWNISILATDINPQFLQKASEGIYREWSFRGTPYWLKENYFTPTRDGNYEILPGIRKMVNFQYLNLVEDSYPSLFNDTNAMDFVFCRNVLMYFTQDRMVQAINRFYQCLMEKGWMVVGSSETSHVFFPQYTACNFPGAILYHKDPSANRRFKDCIPHDHPDFRGNEDTAFAAAMTAEFRARHEKPAPVRKLLRPAPVRAPETDSAEAAQPSPKTEYEEFCTLYDAGDYGAVISRTTEAMTRSAGDPRLMTLLAKAYANQGKLNDAIIWCEKAISTEKLNPVFHHLRAVILQEQGHLDDAIASFKRALYLDSNFVLAHFMLGNLSRQAGKARESRKYFENAMALLKDCGQDAVITESDGLTAGRLKEMIRLTLSREINA
jgi:chemotaxis protein methyltransferase CheR